MNQRHPELWALDMDRTLVDPKPVIDRLLLVCRQVGGIDTEALAAARESNELTGGSFDVLGYLKKQELPMKKILVVQDRFAANEEQDELLYHDARVLLAVLDETDRPHFIPTYGSKDWQQAKLEATGLVKRPYLITDKKYKGELINTWRSNDGIYRLIATAGQSLVARTVHLIDDKADAFRGLPEDCSGYLLVRPEEAQVASQMGELPVNARIIPSLYEVLPAVYSAR